jgi:hypothetical protein
MTSLSKTFGTIFVTALVGFIAFLLASPRKESRKEKKVQKKEKFNLFI